MDNFNPENFLGLIESDQNPDIHIVQLPYEMTTSYGQGTGEGPKAFIEASAQVELFDVRLGKDLPAGLKFSTVKPWESDTPTLRKQLDSMAVFASQFFTGKSFPLFIGGEHGILPPIVSASRNHPLVSPDLSNLTIVQIDAHADIEKVWMTSLSRMLVPHHALLILELVPLFKLESEHFLSKNMT